MDCTKKLILSQGVERVTMEAIAHEAEISKATLYLHFSNKETLFNEICERSSHSFLGYLAQLIAPGSSAPAPTGMEAMKCLWQAYLTQFGHNDEMLIVFQVRNYLANWPPAGQSDSIKSPNVDAILSALYKIVEQCKAEEVFDSNLDSSTAVNLLLMLFSTVMQNTAKLSPAERNSASTIKEMTNTFQTLIRGFAKEGVSHARLDIAEHSGLVS